MKLPVFALLLAASVSTQAADAFLHVGKTDSRARVSVGVKTDTLQDFLGLQVHNELSLSHWSGDGNSWQASYVPLLRYGRRAYIEGGIGVTYFDRRYGGMSSRWMFADHLGVGYGPLGLRLSHFSNAGIKKPNPGLNMLSITFTSRF